MTFGEATNAGRVAGAQHAKKDASFYSQAGAVWCCVSVWDTMGSPSTPPCRCLPLSARSLSCLELCRYGCGGFGVSAVLGAALQGHRESSAGGCRAELWDGATCDPRAGGQQHCGAGRCAWG